MPSKTHNTPILTWYGTPCLVLGSRRSGMVKKAAQRVPKEKKEKKEKKGKPSETPKELLPAPVNWAKSTVTEAVLKKFADAGELPKKTRSSGARRVTKFAPNLRKMRIGRAHV